MPVYQYEDKFYDLPDGLTNEQAIARIQEHLGKGTTVAQPQTQRQELTAGQKAYQSTRDILTPTVEALGTVAGGLIGTPLGPMGTVSGAGLGYGISKGILENIDIAMGVKQPSKSMLEPAAESLKNVAEGATYEVGGRVVAPIIAKGSRSF